MTQLSSDRIAELTILALERTAFIMAEPAQESETTEPTRAASIRYHGPDAGTVTVQTTDEFLCSLASGLLGAEPDSVDVEIEGADALRELANVLGGSVITELGGKDCTYSLGLPSTIPPEDKSESSTQAQTCRLDCEGQLLIVTWTPDSVASKRAA